MKNNTQAFFLIAVSALILSCTAKQQKVPEQEPEKQMEKVAEKEPPSPSGRIALSDTVTVSWTILPFDTTKHKLEYCTEGTQVWMCRIDGHDWWGSDRDMAPPKSELKQLQLRIGNKQYDLETSTMYNPNYSGRLYPRQFRLKQFPDHHMLYAFFSDGAGTYTAYWNIRNGRAERELLTGDEEAFNWQVEE
jgi:hypothetical protein